MQPSHATAVATHRRLQSADQRMRVHCGNIGQPQFPHTVHLLHQPQGAAHMIGLGVGDRQHIHMRKPKGAQP